MFYTESDKNKNYKLGPIIKKKKYLLLNKYFIKLRLKVVFLKKLIFFGAMVGPDFFIWFGCNNTIYTYICASMYSTCTNTYALHPFMLMKIPVSWSSVGLWIYWMFSKKGSTCGCGAYIVGRDIVAYHRKWSRLCLCTMFLMTLIWNETLTVIFIHWRINV